MHKGLAARPVTALLRSRAAAALTRPRGVDHYVALIAPVWSLSEIRARVVSVRREASDTVSISLAPNQNWRGFRAGQHVQLTVTIEGVRHTRTFSISSSPRAGSPLRITIRAFPGGKVSGWAFDHARRGDVVTLSPAAGEFVLPAELPTKLLFVSGGSGITPIMSMLRELLYSGYAGSVTCMHYARSEIIFEDDLRMLAEEFPNLRLITQLTQQSDARFSRDAIDAVLPRWQDTETFVCGPASLERAVREVFASVDAVERLHVERFRPSEVQPVPDADAQTRRHLVFAKSAVRVPGHAGATLLEQAERAGLKPAYGCRMGICHTCTCKKHSGVVRNTVTGRISDAEDEAIQLCVNVPLTDVTLDL